MGDRILVTGTSSGFGKLIVNTLHKAGHQVVGTLREIHGRNQKVAQEFKKAGIHVIDMDVTQEASVYEGVRHCIQHLGGLDTVINNAGVGVLGLQECFTADDWQRVFDINVFGVQRVNRASIPQFRHQGHGLLIHISSLLGRMTVPFYGPYNATKFALEALAENYRLELGGFGIESCIIEPGGYGTDFMNRLMLPSDPSRSDEYGALAKAPEEFFKNFEKNLKGPQAPNPQWVADAVLNLIKTPRGQRPLRTTVDRLGMGEAIESYNQTYDQISQKVYKAFGMENMTKVNIQSPMRSKKSAS